MKEKKLLISGAHFCAEKLEARQEIVVSKHASFISWIN